MKVFISGAISGDPNYESRFNEMEAFLKRRGFGVINPIENEGFSYKEYIDMALFKLMQCDVVVHLDTWASSPGARLEHHYAELIGLPIWYEKDIRKAWG